MDEFYESEYVRTYQTTDFTEYISENQKEIIGFIGTGEDEQNLLTEL